MIVCSCNAVFESTVCNTIAAGADCVEAIGEKCGAGRDCHSCIETLEKLLDEHDRTRELAADRSSAA